MSLTLFLLAVLFTCSLIVWLQLVMRWRAQKEILPLNAEPRALWRSAAQMAVAYVALLYAVSHLVPLFISSGATEHPVVDRNIVAQHVALNIGLTIILILALISRRRPGSEYGITSAQLSDQIRVGILGFLTAVLPMAISMAVTIPLRGPESQHALLKLLLETSDPTTVLLVALLAAVSVPLLEELLFRVILQGFLTTIIPASASITVVAVLFALVHGWRNGLALLPLALILGYVFHRRHSYLAVVVIHSLFNATMLVLQLLIPPTAR